MRFTQHQIDLTFATAGIMIILGYIFLFQRPVNLKIKELRSELTSLSENGSSVKAIESKLDQLSQGKIILSRQIQSMEATLFKTDLLWDLMQDLANMAEEAGLTVILVQPQIKPQTDRYQQSSLIIRVSGDFLSFYHFLAMFEKSVPTLKANSLKIEAEHAPFMEEVQFDLFTLSPS